MIKLLARIFIHDKPDAKDARIRNAYGTLCGLVGVALNVFLFAGKLVAGTLTGSIAIVADAFNNLSDAGASIVTLLGFRIARQRPDVEHPFGHGRMEYIAGLIVSLVIILMGFELLKSSIEKIVAPTPVAYNSISVAILALAVAVKLYMAWYNRDIGRRINAVSMRATAMDSLSDAVATFVVLIAMVLSHWTGWLIDGWCGALVAVFILFAGYKAMRETISPLLGQPPDPAFIAEIEAIVRAHECVIGMHDLIVHDYGPGRRMISLHAEVPADGDLLALHDVIDNIEKELREKLLCVAVIHMDPLTVDDARTNEAKERIEQAVLALDPRVTIHDFRMVTGPTHTNVIFDVVAPFDIKLSEREIRLRVSELVRGVDERYHAVIEVDRAFGAQ